MIRSWRLRSRDGRGNRRSSTDRGRRRPRPRRPSWSGACGGWLRDSGALAGGAVAALELDERPPTVEGAARPVVAFNIARRRQTSVDDSERSTAPRYFFFGAGWCSRRASTARRRARSVAAALWSAFSFFIACSYRKQTTPCRHAGNHLEHVRRRDVLGGLIHERRAWSARRGGVESLVSGCGWTPRFSQSLIGGR